MYEQGTFYYVQRLAGAAEADAGEVWENVLYGDTDQLWRSRGRFTAEKHVHELIRAAGRDPADAEATGAYRLVKREYFEVMFPVLPTTEFTDSGSDSDSDSDSDVPVAVIS